MVDVVNTSNPRLSSLHNGALLCTETFKRQHRLINHLLMLLQYCHCLQILTGYSKINFLHNVYFGLLIFSKLLKPPFIETATYYSVWDTSGISWTICKQSAPHCRQPHQHLIAHFLQAGCSSWRPTNSIRALKAMQHYPNQWPGIMLCQGITLLPLNALTVQHHVSYITLIECKE